jgi:hypothetical protein
MQDHTHQGDMASDSLEKLITFLLNEKKSVPACSHMLPQYTWFCMQRHPNVVQFFGIAINHPDEFHLQVTPTCMHLALLKLTLVLVCLVWHFV